MTKSRAFKLIKQVLFWQGWAVLFVLVLKGGMALFNMSNTLLAILGFLICGLSGTVFVVLPLVHYIPIWKFLVERNRYVSGGGWQTGPAWKARQDRYRKYMTEEELKQWKLG